MSMLLLNGTVKNVIDVPASVDKKTGEVQQPFSRVQVEAVNELEDGQKRFELVTLKVQDGKPYSGSIGLPVRVPVGAFASAGAVVFYALKGVLPEFDIHGA